MGLNKANKINTATARILGYQVSLAESCLIFGGFLCVLSVFGHSACYAVNHCVLISPYYSGTYVGKYIPTVFILAAGLLLIFAALYPSVALFALATAASYAGIAGVIGLFISVAVEAGEFDHYLRYGVGDAIWVRAPTSKFWIWLAHVFLQGLVSILCLAIGGSHAMRGLKLLRGSSESVYAKTEVKLEERKKIEVRKPEVGHQYDTVEA